ncbi:MAG: Ribonuclease HII [Saprospiraceae bacterium]|jgi:ribonuclease HII|nr:Ribonuclease HII [Saprospiraceae bacterium]
MPSLQTYYKNLQFECGCDEAGRGCLAGPVFAAAVILDNNYPIAGLDDSKKLSAGRRALLRKEIEEKAYAWAVARIEVDDIDRHNILQASLMAMRQAIGALSVQPLSVIVDGNRSIPELSIPQSCHVNGDASFESIAAASILAKTHRDAWMERLHLQFPEYGWMQNKGYATEFHRKAIFTHGLTEHHRKSFSISMNFNGSTDGTS